MPSDVKAPTRTIAFYSRIGIWLALLFIALGLSLQSLQVNIFTQATLDKAYAEAMAKQMALGLSLKLSETHLQQKNAARQPRSVNALTTPDPEWKRTLKSLISGAENIYILDRATATGLQETLGYAVQELASRTLKGEEYPLEAVKRNNQIHFYLSTPIRDSLKRIRGILLIEYGSDWLNQLRSGAAAQHGLISVTQILKDNPNKGLNVFEVGHQANNQLTVVTESINDYWFLTFIPADARPKLALVPIITPWLIAMAGTLLTLILLTWMQRRAFDKNRLLLLNYVRQLYRKSENNWPPFTIRLFHDVAKTMEHLANSRAPAAAEVATDPDREKQTIELTRQTPKPTSPGQRPEAVIPQVTVEEVDQNATDVPRHLFRSYDILGTSEIDLTPEVAEVIGLSLGSELQTRGMQKIIIGQDGRRDSVKLADSLSEGLMKSGCDIIRIGTCPIGQMYFATHELDTNCGVMVTASHNPANYNGFRIVVGGKTLAKESLIAVYHRIQRQDFSSGQGQCEERQLNELYTEQIRGDIHLSRPLKVVLDGSNGTAGPVVRSLMKVMGLNIIPLNCDIDGNFPAHPPNPSVEKNLSELKKAVLENKADIGLCFDGDGDRLAVVDNTGKVIMPDRILMYLSKEIVSRNPGCDIVYDVKSSRRLNTCITGFGGRPTMWKTGHALIKEKMAELNAMAGAELSGHYYFRDRWYGFDDAIYAAARLLESFSQQMNSVSEIMEEFPDDISTAEISLQTKSDERKFEIIKQIASDPRLQKNARVSTIDGVRSDFSVGWGLIRASNTSQDITLRFAGADKEALKNICALYKAVLKQHAPELTLPF